MKTLLLAVLFPVAAPAASIVMADFNGSPIVETPGTVTVADLNAGTTGAGSWTIDEVEDSQIRHQAGDEANRALTGDRGPYQFTLTLDNALTLATDQVTVSFDTQIIRTISSENTKKNFVTGYDSSDAKVFEIVITTDAGTNDDRGRIRYLDGATETTLISDLPSVNSNPGDFTVSDFANVLLTLNASSYDIDVTGAGNASFDGAAFVSGAPLDLKRIEFRGSGPGNVDNDDAGAYFDNISVDAIPEPAATVLGLLGTLALLRRRR